MKVSKLFMAVIVMATVGFVSCKPKDADIKASVDKVLQANPAMSAVTADVKDAVVTLVGTTADDAAKTQAGTEVKNVKGVKEVINSISVPAPPPAPASVTTVLNETTQQQVKDGLKDIPGVTVTFSEDKAIISGAVTRADRMKIMQMLASAKVKSDVSNLSDKE